MSKCNRQTEIYTRVCGYHRPVQFFNEGKKEEFYDRLTFNPVLNEKEVEKLIVENKTCDCKKEKCAV